MRECLQFIRSPLLADFRGTNTTSRTGLSIACLNSFAKMDSRDRHYHLPNACCHLTLTVELSIQVKITPVVSFDWTVKHYTGQLVAVDRAHKYVAYALKGTCCEEPLCW